MKGRSSLTRNRKLRCILLLLILLILVTTFLCLRIDTTTDDGNDDTLGPNNNPRPLQPAEVDNAALAYIPRSVVETWGQREFLIVVGIPSVDNEERRRRRILQRSTCWLFPGVATRANNFTGAMLVLYMFGRHPSHGYNYSAALQEEAAQWHDVVALPVNEGRVTTNKKIGEGGSWGDEAEVGMSRKTYLWFDLALRVFPTVNHIVKTDDDMFLRVPYFLSSVRVLPRRGIYMGYHMGITSFGKRKLPGNTFMVGWCYTLSRDVAEALVSYKPLQRLVYLPYSKERKDDFYRYCMQHEDVMVAYVLLEEVKYKPVIHVKALPCAFHDARNKRGHSQVTSTSMLVHHIREDDYAALMARFGNDPAHPPARASRASEDVYYITCD